MRLCCYNAIIRAYSTCIMLSNLSDKILKFSQFISVFKTKDQTKNYYPNIIQDDSSNILFTLFRFY